MLLLFISLDSRDLFRLVYQFIRLGIFDSLLSGTQRFFQTINYCNCLLIEYFSGTLNYVRVVYDSHILTGQLDNILNGCEPIIHR